MDGADRFMLWGILILLLGLLIGIALAFVL
jgi:hypothetical protein